MYCDEKVSFGKFVFDIDVYVRVFIFNKIEDGLVGY